VEIDRLIAGIDLEKKNRKRYEIIGVVNRRKELQKRRVMALRGSVQDRRLRNSEDPLSSARDVQWRQGEAKPRVGDRLLGTFRPKESEIHM